MLYKSAMTTAASGSVGGMTASRNKGGQYMRARTVPTNPNTPFQQVVREAMGMLASAWQTLTQPQRDSWNAYALNVTMANALGDQIQLSGLNWFIRTNTVAQQQGLALLTDAPTVFNLGSTPQLLVTSTLVVSTPLPAGLVLNFEIADGQAADLLNLYISRPQNQTIEFFRGPYRFFTGDAVAGNLTTFAIAPTDLPFPVAAAQKLFVRATVLKEDGRLSANAQIALIAT